MPTSNGTTGNDSLTGSSVADQIAGLVGDDTLSGGAGADLIAGGDGNDIIEGGTGLDTLQGGAGDDYLAAADLTNHAAAGSARDTLPAVTADDASADYLDGGSGNDTLIGAAGNDLLVGGAGNDLLSGAAGGDTLIGGLGQDRIIGGTGNDVIHGDEGPFTPPGSGFGSAGTVQQVNQILTGNQTPPVSLVLADGRLLHVWADTSNILQGRIYDAGGAAATDQFSLPTLWRVSATTAFDWDSLSLDRLADGRVVVSYVRDIADGPNEPVFALLDPAVAPGQAGFIALPNVEVQSNDDTDIESPPVTTVLANGRVLFVWSENAALDDTTSMVLRGRIYDPATNGWTSGDFTVGTVAVDGSDSRLPALSVTQLQGGNVVVGWARSNAETGFNEPVYTVLDQTGATVFATAEVEGTDTESQVTVWESPPVITALADGRWMAVWVNDGYSDDTNTMTLEGRIFNANGTPATADFRIGSTAVDGSAFDNPSVTLTEIAPGRVVVGYVETYATGATTYPTFSIVDTATGTVLAADVMIAQSPDSPWPGPPVITALGNGNFVAVFADGNQWSAANAGLVYRVFDANGTALTGDVQIAVTGADAALSNTDFNWASVSVVYNATNNSFAISWVGNSDGGGTGVYTTGPIAAPGGFTSTTPATVGGADLIEGGDGADSVLGGAGNDTITAAQGDTIAGGAGDDDIRLTDLSEPGAGTIRVAGDGGFDTLRYGTLKTKGSLTTTGDATSGYAGSMTLTDGSIVTFTGVEAIVCFVRGTRVLTPSGPRAVETLRPGDLVTTCDHGPRPLRWIGARKVTAAEMRDTPAKRPLRLVAGGLGPGMPARDLYLSAQHRVLLANRVVERMFDHPEILVPVKDLTGPAASVCDPVDVEYWHLLFDRHEVLLAEGAAVESLYLGPEALAGFPAQAVLAIARLFPSVLAADAPPPFPPARPLYRGAKVRALVERSVRNGHALVAPRADRWADHAARSG